MQTVSAAVALEGNRVRGGIAAHFGLDQRRSVVRSLTERGGYRLLLPSTFASHIEAAQLNTGGGVAGGDRIETTIAVDSGADVVLSTQGAERIYRSAGAASEMHVSLRLAAAARLDWLPQQTIVFSGARLRRRIDIEMAADSCLSMVEVLTYGRPASAEGAAPTDIGDQWRVRRDGRLVFAEALQLSGRLAALLDRAAIGGGARSSAIVLHVAPDAEERRDEARQATADARCEAGISAWNGMLCARLLGRAPADVIAAAARLTRTLARRDMPRVWAI